MQEYLDGSSGKTNHKRRTKFSTVKTNQRRSTRRNSIRILRKIAQSFAIIATNLVMSNKTANFLRNILNNRRKVRKKQCQPLGVTVMS